MTQAAKIEIPKSHTTKVKNTEKAEWKRAPTLQGDEDDKILHHFMEICMQVIGQYNHDDESAPNNRKLLSY